MKLIELSRLTELAVEPPLIDSSIPKMSALKDTHMVTNAEFSYLTLHGHYNRTSFLQLERIDAIPIGLYVRKIDPGRLGTTGQI